MIRLGSVQDEAEARCRLIDSITAMLAERGSTQGKGPSVFDEVMAATRSTNNDDET